MLVLSTRNVERGLSAGQPFIPWVCLCLTCMSTRTCILHAPNAGQANSRRSQFLMLGKVKDVQTTCVTCTNTCTSWWQVCTIEKLLVFVEFVDHVLNPLRPVCSHVISQSDVHHLKNSLHFALGAGMAGCDQGLRSVLFRKSTTRLAQGESEGSVISWSNIFELHKEPETSDGKGACTGWFLEVH